MYHCGIDVAKRKLAAGLLTEAGQEYKPVFSVDNTRAGMDKLVHELSVLDEPVRVGLEATGHYSGYRCMTS